MLSVPQNSGRVIALCCHEGELGCRKSDQIGRWRAALSGNRAVPGVERAKVGGPIILGLGKTQTSSASSS